MATIPSRHSALLAVVASVAVMAGCGDDPNAGSTSTTPGSGTTASVTEPPTAGSSIPSPLTGEVVLDDTFDDDRNGWGEIPNADIGSVLFVDGSYQWRNSAPIFPWTWGGFDLESPPDFRNIVLHAEGTLVGGKGVVGVFCRATADSDAQFQFYDFVVRDGYAAIRLSDDALHIEPLAESREVSVPTGSPFTVDGTCVDQADGSVLLQLALNGTTVLSTSVQNGLGNGFAGLMLASFPEGEATNVDWHRLTVTRVADSEPAVTTGTEATGSESTQQAAGAGVPPEWPEDLAYPEGFSAGAPTGSPAPSSVQTTEAGTAFSFGGLESPADLTSEMAAWALLVGLDCPSGSFKYDCAGQIGEHNVVLHVDASSAQASAVIEIS